ncbi:MAG: C-terminal binding protein [Cyanobacteria bacterium]|nr:C-terminal binding protein [Cyanobacteriota bacterium]
MSNPNFIIVRLNSDTYPVLPIETKEFNKIGGKVIYIEGSTSDEIIKVAKDCDALSVVSSKIKEDIINQLNKCRIIARQGVGVDNINVEAATEKGIVVTNVPDFCFNEMAEHAMALIIGSARNIVKMDRNTRNCKWSSRVNEHLKRINGKILGLIGFGNSARAVAIRALPFGLKIYAYDAYIDGSIIKRHNVEPTTFEFIIKNCDFISLHVPLNQETYHLIGENELKSMKKSAILINTSRGAVIDEDMLVKALKEGWISGAGIDVFEKINTFDETEEKIDNPLFHLENIILTPHCAAMSDESMFEVKQKYIKQVIDVLSGKWPSNVVNPDVSPRFSLIR